ncbi:hypothetical protein AGMMS49974_05270 [Deltaproteobacteria bacterium]|nr:hypothetical protein AGMMS49974_05270 [Deltaproteobacteria bacterium]GHU98332.1 hypothetical protein AGMMS50248_04730 [Deltaproteobacteria bacterium]
MRQWNLPSIWMLNLTGIGRMSNTTTVTMALDHQVFVFGDQPLEATDELLQKRAV